MGKINRSTSPTAVSAGSSYTITNQTIPLKDVINIVTIPESATFFCINVVTPGLSKMTIYETNLLASDSFEIPLGRSFATPGKILLTTALSIFIAVSKDATELQIMVWF